MNKKLIVSLATGIGAVGGAIFGGLQIKKTKKQLSECQSRASKYREYYTMNNEWILALNQHKSVAKYLKEHDYERVAIYGLGEMGERLYEMMQNEGIKPIYGIDKSISNIPMDLDVYTTEDELPDADLIVVTPVFAYDSIKDELEKQTDIPVISLTRFLSDL